MTEFRLPFIAAIQEKVLGLRAPRHSLTPHWMLTEAGSETRPMEAEVVLSFAATVQTRQVIKKEELERSREDADGEREWARRRAVRTMAHHVYGPVENELRAALVELWEDGLHHTKAAARIEAMLPILRGEVAP